jgi:MoaA/NifB/PqqE/SkfB family radical SAM enzyme
MLKRPRRRKSYRELKERNLALNSSESAQGLTRLQSAPVSLYVDINLKCNLRCPSCHRNHPQYEGHEWPTMPFETFERVAGELFPTAYRVMLTGGGESLVHPEIDRILDLCARYEVFPTIVTNGTTVTVKRAKLLAAAGAYVGVSTDGARRETFERLRYPGRWDRFLQSLENLKVARDEAGNVAFFPHLQVVVQRDNIDELPGFIELAHKYGFELVKFSNLYPHFPALEGKVPDPARASLSFVEVFGRANEYRIRVEVPEYGDVPDADELARLRLLNTFPVSLDDSPSAKYVTGGFVKYPDALSSKCGVPWSETMITPEGEVVVGCCSQHRLGELGAGPFKDIWNGESYRVLRETVNSAEPMEFCEKSVCPFRLQIP